LARGTISVQVAREDTAIGGATVVFHDPSGEAIRTAQTDIYGVAKGEIIAGGAVTVLDPLLDEYLTTFTNVEPGKRVQVPLQKIVGPTVAMLTIAAPTTAPPPGTGGYAIDTPCGGRFVESLPATIAVPGPCGPGSPVLVFASSPAELDTLGYSLAWVAARVDGDAVVRPAAWSTSCLMFERDTNVELSLEILPRFGGHAFRLGGLKFCGAEPPSAPTLDFGEGAVVRGVARVDGTAPRTTQLLRDVASIPTTVQVSKADDLLFGWVALDGLDTQGASWTPNEALADADAIDVTLQYISRDHFVHWRFVLPPDAREAVLPAVPSELDTWGMPTEADRAIFEIRYVDALWLDRDLAAVHRDAPLILDGVKAQPDIPRGAALRTYLQRF
jgi:hypothetical protein